jgi:hypothetical protein
MWRNKCFFRVRIARVLRFISICVLFTDSPSYCESVSKTGKATLHRIILYVRRDLRYRVIHSHVMMKRDSGDVAMRNKMRSGLV